MQATPAIEIRSINGAALPFSGTKLVQNDEHGPFVVLARKKIRRRFGKKPTPQSHTQDYALVREILQLLPDHIEELELEETGERPHREFWRQLCEELRTSMTL